MPESHVDFRAGVNSFVLWFVYLFVARFIVGYIATLTISISSIRTTRTLREALLSHMLRAYGDLAFQPSSN